MAQSHVKHLEQLASENDGEATYVRLENDRVHVTVRFGSQVVVSEGDDASDAAKGAILLVEELTH